jgi:hexosaminidase
MKKIFKILLYLTAGILGLIAALVVFLFIYYSVLEKKQRKTDKAMAGRAENITISSSQTQVRSEDGVLNLLPVPQKVTLNGGKYSFPKSITFSVPDSLKSSVEGFLRMIPDTKVTYSRSGGDVQIRYNKALPVQGYILVIKSGNIMVEFSNRQGLYYAIISLKVLRQNYAGSIPCCSIEDSPDLAVRGLMLDISRNKVPTKETLLGIAQLLSDLKYNHFELYVEGFSFAYPSFKNLWEGKETPVTGPEIQELDAFCRAHFIDLTANQNSLGHMMSWLATDKYKDLAECPKGFKMFGLISTKTTLDPSDPGSIELVSKMMDDLLPNFTSPNFNVNLDEPFELGKGKNKELVSRKGEGEVYLDYTLKLHDIVLAKNKKMMMWGDIVLKHPELIPRIPKDITLLDWGYESSYPYEKHCKTLQESGLEYMVCPGTNSWTSITGRTDNMLATVEVATTNAVKYGAKGMLITDWGDMGHWQYLPVSYAGYAVGGALSWNSGSRKELPLAAFLNNYVFRDKNSVMGDLVLDLGRYNRFEEFPMMNMTTTMLAFQFGIRNKIMINSIFGTILSGITALMKDISPESITLFKDNYDNRRSFDYKGLQAFIDSKEVLLSKSWITTPDSLIIHDEYLNALRLIRLGEGLKKYIDFKDTMSIDEEKSELKAMKQLGEKYLLENRKLWMLRNKSGGYELSILSLNSLMKQIDDRLLLLNKSSFSRGWNRFLEKIGTSAAVLYLGTVSG